MPIATFDLRKDTFPGSIPAAWVDNDQNGGVSQYAAFDGRTTISLDSGIQDADSSAQRILDVSGFTIGAKYSMTLWLYHAKLADASAFDAFQIFFGRTGSNHKLKVYIRSDGISVAGSSGTVHVAGSSTTTGKWYQLTLAIDSTDIGDSKVTIWKNGALVGRDIDCTNVAAFTDFRISQHSTGAAPTDDNLLTYIDQIYLGSGLWVPRYNKIGLKTSVGL